jgi:hypothetical protein
MLKRLQMNEAFLKRRESFLLRNLRLAVASKKLRPALAQNFLSAQALD